MSQPYSTYPDDPASQNFVQARARGFEEGEGDLANRGAIHDRMAYLAQMGRRDVHGRNNRAWYLGFLRGYREAVRSCKSGRWGT